MKHHTKILALLLSLLMIVSLMSGCGEKPVDEEPASAPESSSSSQADKPKPSTSDKTVGEATPDNTELVEEKYELNDHTVGWLYVPNTDVDDVVVQHPTQWNFYERRNFEKEDYFNGIFFAELDCDFGDGTRKDLPVNTVIYGHALTDKRDHANYPIMFGTLHNFRDEDDAKNMPYIFYSSQEENMAFEVFAVFMINADNPEIPYNRDTQTADEFYEMVTNEILPRSIYNYNVELSPEDHFITLSTCIYDRLDEGVTGYPKTYMRYAIMGKLVDPDEPLKEKADFTINEEPVFDADGAIGSAK